MDKTVFNRARNGMHPHDLVHYWFVLFDRVRSLIDQLLDQLRPRCLVFDHDRLGTKRPLPALAQRASIRDNQYACEKHEGDKHVFL
jgi:hypothetical protein